MGELLAPWAAFARGGPELLKVSFFFLVFVGAGVSLLDLEKNCRIRLAVSHLIPASLRSAKSTFQSVSFRDCNVSYALRISA
jgi:hypothetical protein